MEPTRSISSGPLGGVFLRIRFRVAALLESSVACCSEDSYPSRVSFMGTGVGWSLFASREEEHLAFRVEGTVLRHLATLGHLHHGIEQRREYFDHREDLLPVLRPLLQLLDQAVREDAMVVLIALPSFLAL